MFYISLSTCTSWVCRCVTNPYRSLNVCVSTMMPSSISKEGSLEEQRLSTRRFWGQRSWKRCVCVCMYVIHSLVAMTRLTWLIPKSSLTWEWGSHHGPVPYSSTLCYICMRLPPPLLVGGRWNHRWHSDQHYPQAQVSHLQEPGSHCQGGGWPLCCIGCLHWGERETWSGRSRST